MNEEFKHIVRLDSRKVNITEASEWAVSNIPVKQFEVKHTVFPSPYWHFCFKNVKHASHFTLKWSH